MGKVYQNLAHTLPNSNLHHHESNKCHIRGRFSFDVHEHKSTHSALSAFCQLRFSFVFLLSPTKYSGVYSSESCHSRTLHSLPQVGHLAQTSHSGEYPLSSRSMLRLSPSASNMHPHRGQMKRTGDFRSFPRLMILVAIAYLLFNQLGPARRVVASRAGCPIFGFIIPIVIRFIISAICIEDAATEEAGKPACQLRFHGIPWLDNLNRH